MAKFEQILSQLKQLIFTVVTCSPTFKVTHHPACIFKVNKPEIQADRLLCLFNVLANSQF